ncbi:MAG TPA: hypothetical protein VNZ45_16330 [Bacteroidia bacterium]|jgi:hypothetical protein|nr:hypothetical protein [Bacteroidia bacterium]
MKNFSLITGAFLITFLVSCSSSNQVASSFGERKYMKGHFSDPIATIKATYASTNINSKPAITHNIQKAEILNTVSSPCSIMNRKVPSNVVTKAIGSGKKQGQLITPVNASSSISFKENTSLKVSSDESISEYHHNANADTSEHHYLKFFLIFLLICLIFLLLILVFGASGAGVVCGLIAIASFIIALVFLFLWLISLAGNNT